MELKTKRLTIREISHSDADQISRLNHCNTVDSHLATLTDEQIAAIFMDKSAVADLLNRLANSADTGNGTVYGAFKEDSLIGFVAIVANGTETPELQIEMDPNYQGQGYGSEFLQALLPYLFAHEKYDAVRYTVLPSNTASIALATKMGALLQPPVSEAERLLIKTFLISKLSMEARIQHLSLD